MKIFNIEMPIEEFDALMVAQANGKKLVVENGQVVAKDRVITQEEMNQNKLAELTNWFKTDYATYEQMLVRRKTLGIEDTIVDEFRNKTYHNLIELYEEAEVVAKEIRELRK